MTGRKKNKVDVHVDFITSVGNKLLLTAGRGGAGQGRSRRHRVLYVGRRRTTPTRWPIDDLMNRLIGKYGPVNETSYLPGEDQRTLASAADQLRHADQTALRADKLVQEAGAGPAGDVSGAARAQRAAGPVDLGAMFKYAEAAQKDNMTFGMGSAAA